MSKSMRARFAELRSLREAGKTAFDSFKVSEAEDLYEEVDEERYKKIVRERLNEDDFVVDDNGEGYADDGREEWDRAAPYDETDSEEGDAVGPRGPRGGNKSKAAQKKDEQSRRENDRDISAYFTNGGAPKPQPKARVSKTKADDDFLAGLLGEVDSKAPAPVLRPRPGERRRARRDLSPAPDSRPPVAKKKKVLDDRLPSPPVLGYTARPKNDNHHRVEDPFSASFDDAFDDDDDLAMLDMDDPVANPIPSSPTPRNMNTKVRIKAESLDDDEDDDTMMEIAHADTITAASVNMAASRPARKPSKQEPTSSPVKPPQPDVDASSWNRLTEQLNLVTSSQSEARPVGKLGADDVVEADGSLNLFWTDYTEVNGSLCLFGKVKHKKTGTFTSCFVKIDKICRKLYFLPRPSRMKDGKETGEEVSMMDVYSEVDEIMTRLKVDKHRIKKCTRKYAFELPNIPKEAEYLKLLYDYTKPALDPSLSGQTFSHVFGTNTALFEQFVLWKNIMGPCWLNIKAPDFDSLKNASHSKLDVLVSDPDSVSTISDSKTPEDPTLILMSLALRMTFNARQNKQEILAISARIYENVSLSDTTPAEKLPCRTFTVIRPNGAAFPLGFETLTKKRSKGLVKLMKQESELLTYFLAQLDLVDPDVILGHQLEGVDYSVLLNRLHDNKVHQWSRLGRYRRSQWPFSVGKVGSNVFAERQVMAGRLLCDLFNDCGKSAMYKCQSWTLTEMCSLYLPGSDKRRDVDNEVALKTWATTKEGLMDYITHMEADTHFITALALQVQLLPLTKVLTNLAGNSWARTLTGTRAERNEYILLHEFHRNKYICPDKQLSKGKQQQQQQREDDHDGENAEAGGKKKDKYKGGLVFEPEKGLYDKFVLVMDFNSLYPSIIQEFNICFTTVDRSDLSEDQDAVPDVPQDQDLGILPKLIATLVSRRRAVKNLMKDKKATPEQLATWDIKQLALKLTANSMYGCLGYTKSRFYARPLAVLTTFKGREILRSTKELAESKSLQVIYGDTDSVMINANVETVADALKVGHEFKLAVNERYRLLEIDIDNVFRRILLQAKKKYAAINLVEQDGKFVEKMEVKGLDMKRREYCALSKEVSARLLQEILSGNDTEASVARIHEYLRDTAAKMREGSVPVPKYTIFTQLGKAPKDYPNAESMPQVQVALREMARGKTVRKGDVISYIITTAAPTSDGGDDDDGSGNGKIAAAAPSSEPAPKRAFPPADVKPGSGLVPDVEWYIGKQIFPPVERLCANITGTSTAQLGEQLGLDVRKYSTVQNQQGRSGGGGNDQEIHPLESLIPDEVRFGDCVRLSLRCRPCESSPAPVAPTTFEGLLVTPDLASAAGLLCASCGAVMPALSVAAQLEHAIRQQTARYYEGWLVCDDPSCDNRTRQMSVYGTRCLGPKGLAADCLGRMHYEYSEKAIYNQLVYFATLFDVDRAKARAAEGLAAKTITAEQRVRVDALAEHNRKRFGTLKGVVDRYLDKCGRQWVAMDSLFAKLGLVKSL